MSQDNFPSPRTIQTVIFVAILVALFIAVCTLFAPFVTVLLWSVLIYTLLSPLHRKITGNMNFTKTPGLILKNIIAGLFSLGTTVLILIPLFFAASQFYLQIVDMVRLFRNMISANPMIFDDIFKNISNFITDLSNGLVIWPPDEIQRDVMQALSSGAQQLIGAASSLARNISAFAIGIVFMFFCLFFFFLDGAYLSNLVAHIIPIRREYMAALMGKFKESIRNLFLGYIMVALAQAVMAYIVFSIFRVQGSLVLAALSLVCSFIPMFGAGLVWAPIGIFRIVSGQVAGGILFLAVAGICISLLDNFLRPIFLQDRIHLHPLVIFVSILGGVAVYGFNGLVLGPLLVILFLTVLDMFLAEHQINID
ncbi:MAG: AI-2E family transporter [Spirochaetaceae bacterium]|nr:AI-2E family transporter [Spirochaetaceae bacterium]